MRVFRQQLAMVLYWLHTCSTWNRPWRRRAGYHQPLVKEDR